MIEEAYRLETYLPLSYPTTKERDYVRFLWEAFNTNVEHEKYQFAFLAYHMLVMSFVYFNIWQIKLIRPRDFDLALVGFVNKMETDLSAATSPFVFSVVNERSVLRFLKLIECDYGKIGNYAKLVDERNLTAHANGNIFFNTEQELTRKIHEVLRTVEEIQSHSQATIEAGYRDFLLRSRDPENGRQWVEDDEQIEEALVKAFYMSSSDMDFCRGFDIQTLSAEQGVPVMESLHRSLSVLYPPEEDAA